MAEENCQPRGKLSVITTARVVADATAYREQPAITELDIHISLRPAVSFLNGDDIMALVQIVMMECAKTNAEVLRNIMEELRRENRSKRRENRSNRRRLRTEAISVHTETIWDQPTMEKEVRLQDLMPRVTRTSATISNMLRKFAVTSQCITKHMK